MGIITQKFNPEYEQQKSRRELLKTIGVVSTASLIGVKEGFSQNTIKLKSNIKHSVCRWCYGSIPFEELCQGVKDIGMASIELTGPKEWPILKTYGLTAAIGWGDWPNGMGLHNFSTTQKPRCSG